MGSADRHRLSDDDLESLLEFESLISGLSSRFINLSPGDVDREIQGGLRRICEFLDLDFLVLWQLSSADPGAFTATHFHYSEEGRQPPEPLRHEQFPWYTRQMQAGCMVAHSSLDEFPVEAAVDRESALRLGIRSNLCLPLTLGGEGPMGVLALNSMRKERDWPDFLVKRMKLVAQVFTNALARQRHERRLEESEERLALAADSAEAGLWTLEYGTGVFWATARARSIFGYSPDEIIDMQRFESSVHPDDWKRVRDAMERSERTGESIDTEFRIRVEGHGGVRWIACRGRPHFGPTGQPERLMGLSIDITEKRRSEEALRQSFEEIARLKDRLQAESDYLKAEIKVVHPHGEVTGKSSAIRKVLSLVEQVASTDSTVLVLGETGTGKELVAQAVHRLSARRSHLLVKVNCAALPSGLVESELFGREKGAFTGAMTRQIGRFEVADCSTLFLDEIGELSLDVQAKLLRVLETGEFERLGSPKTLKVNVRLIAATHRDLAEDVRKGRFRQDLFYRIHVFPIRVPPLRERVEDIPLLVWTFLEEFSSRMAKRITQVPRQTMEALQRYPWPGNVRELKNVIERGAIVTTGDTLRVPMLEDSAPLEAAPPTLADSEREFILRALETTGWRIKGPSGAAAALGLNASTLYGRMKKLGIRPTGQAPDRSV